jgi:spore germination protein KB
LNTADPRAFKLVSSFSADCISGDSPPICPGVNDRRKIKTTAIAAVLAAGILLSVNIVCMISVLGPDLYGRLIYPLLSVVRMASVADFLERIDAVVILFMVAGGFFKVGVYIYGAAAAMAHLFKLQSYHTVLVPLGLIVIALGQIMAKNFVQLDNLKKFTYPFVYLPLQFVIPTLLLFIAFFHKRVKNSMG